MEMCFYVVVAKVAELIHLDVLSGVYINPGIPATGPAATCVIYLNQTIIQSTLSM